MSKSYEAGTMVGLASVVGSRILTAYGAWAVRQFIGQEMFELVLPGNPTDWSWPNFFILPAIPLSLVAARLRSDQHIVPLAPLLLLWPYIPQERHYHVNLIRSTSIKFKRTRPSLLSIPPAWPPSPLEFGLIIFPLVRVLYRKLFRKLESHVLAQQGGDDFDFDARNSKNIEENNGNNNIDNIDNIEDHIRNDPAIVAPYNYGWRQNINLVLTVGGALSAPVIASLMGSVLYHLSEHTPALKAFLGIRPPLISSLGNLAATGPAHGIPADLGTDSANGRWVGLPVENVKEMLNGAGWAKDSWAEADHVWWRNSVGLGVFVLTRDCIDLWYRWSAQRGR